MPIMKAKAGARKGRKGTVDRGAKKRKWMRRRNKRQERVCVEVPL